jgi:activator of HSP90 ATPase
MDGKNEQSRQKQDLTRRDAIRGFTMAVGGLALSSTELRAAPQQESIHTAESIHLEPVFKASRQRVYDALTQSQEFDKVVQLSAAAKSGMVLANAPTEISRVEGGTFKLFGGHIVGRQVELVPNERIVQAWRVVDWPAGVYSIVRFELVDQGPETQIVFDHTGFPNGQAEHLAEGWRSNYWAPLKQFLS